MEGSHIHNDLFRCQKDYYAVLRISYDASDEEIRSAYKSLAKKHHPDTNKNDPAANQRMAEINEAYKVLSTPSLKSDYDLHRAMRNEGANASYTSSPEARATHHASSRQKSDIRRSKRKRTKRIVFAAAVVLVLTIAAAVIWLDVILPRQREAREFERAMQMLDTGFYEEAYQKLEELGRQDMIEASKRERAASKDDPTHAA